MFSSTPALGFFRPARGVRLSGFGYPGDGDESSAFASVNGAPNGSNTTGTNVANIIGGIAQGAASIVGSIFGSQAAAANAQGAAAIAASQQQMALVQLEQQRLQSRDTMFIVGGVALLAVGAFVALRK